MNLADYSKVRESLNAFYDFAELVLSFNDALATLLNVRDIDDLQERTDKLKASLRMLGDMLPGKETGKVGAPLGVVLSSLPKGLKVQWSRGAVTTITLCITFTCGTYV